MKKVFFTLDCFCGRRWFPLLFIPIAVCFLLLYSFTTSPLFLNDGMDSAVFKTMGLAILKGKVPYVDIFDHKGPVLYFINALGQWLVPGRTGIFLLQVIGLSVALLYLFKTANLFINRGMSFVAVLVTLFIYGGVIQEGNQCEEWMMYFFSIALYYALSYMVKQSNKPHPLSFGFLYGLCFGMTFFIRPNDAVAVIGGIMTGLTIWLVYKNEYKNAIYNALCFVMGFAIVAIPVVSYFVYHHAIDDMLYGLIGFNITYSGGGLYLLKSVLDSNKASMAMVFIAMGVLVFEAKDHKNIMVVLIPVLLFELLLIGGNCFPHYYIVLVPLYLIYIVNVELLVLKNKRQNKSLFLLSLIILLLSSILSSSVIGISSYSLKQRLVPFAHGRAYNRINGFYLETDALLSILPDYERDSVWNYNLKWGTADPCDCSAFSALWHHGIVQCNLITYGSDEVLCKKDNVVEKEPLWIILDSKRIEEEKAQIKEMFINNQYDLVAKTDTTICNIELYHRK